MKISPEGLRLIIKNQLLEAKKKKDAESDEGEEREVVPSAYKTDKDLDLMGHPLEDENRYKRQGQAPFGPMTCEHRMVVSEGKSAWEAVTEARCLDCGVSIAEAHLGFKKLKNKLAHKKGVTDPGALAASIGRKKYGKKKFQKMAAKGHKKG